MNVATVRLRAACVLLCVAVALTGCGGGSSTSNSGAGGADPGSGQAGGGPGSVGGASGSFSGPALTPTGGASLTVVHSFLTGQGNAGGLAWSDDGNSVFLADGSSAFSAMKINASNPSQPVSAAASGAANNLWSVGQSGGLLVFQQAPGTQTVGVDPNSFQVLWQVATGPSHAIATDGSRVFVPVEGKPATLIVLNSNGGQVASVPVSDGWANVSEVVADAAHQRVYVASGAGQGVPGGVYVFDTSQSPPVLLGKVPGASGGVAVDGSGTRLWQSVVGGINAWNLSNPVAPALLGTYTAPPFSSQHYGQATSGFGSLAVNAAGTRLYAAYSTVPVSSGQVGDQVDPAGVAIFDVSGSTPAALQGGNTTWQIGTDTSASGAYEIPQAVALSPNGQTLAVSYYAFGVRLFSVAGDAFAAQGQLATTGEARDVYVDAQGVMYVFNRDSLISLDPNSGAQIQAFPSASVVDGGWQSFRDGRIVVPGTVTQVVQLQNGGVAFQQFLPSPGGSRVWAVAFDGTTYLYSAGDAGTIYVQQITLSSSGTYNASLVGEAQVPGATGPFVALALGGTTLWALGPSIGLAAFDVSAPSAPRLVYQDTFTFTANDNHAGLVIAQGRVYAAAGTQGVGIYNPSTLTRSGWINGLDANFLDQAGTTFLVVSSSAPGGVYFYDISGNPDAPSLAAAYPGANSPTLRARVAGNLAYRLPLDGVDVLQWSQVAVQDPPGGNSSGGGASSSSGSGSSLSGSGGNNSNLVQAWQQALGLGSGFSGSAGGNTPGGGGATPSMSGGGSASGNRGGSSGSPGGATQGGGTTVVSSGGTPPPPSSGGKYPLLATAVESDNTFTGTYLGQHFDLILMHGFQADANGNSTSALNAQIKAANPNAKIIYYTFPQIVTGNEPWAESMPESYYLHNPPGSITQSARVARSGPGGMTIYAVDMSNPNARAFLEQQLVALLNQYGHFDGIFDDGYFEDGTIRFASGGACVNTAWDINPPTDAQAAAWHANNALWYSDLASYLSQNGYTLLIANSTSIRNDNSGSVCYEDDSDYLASVSGTMIEDGLHQSEQPASSVGSSPLWFGYQTGEIVRNLTHNPARIMYLLAGQTDYNLPPGQGWITWALATELLFTDGVHSYLQWQENTSLIDPAEVSYLTGINVGAPNTGDGHNGQAYSPDGSGLLWVRHFTNKTVTVNADPNNSRGGLPPLSATIR
jgi:hypothetical protein